MDRMVCDFHMAGAICLACDEPVQQGQDIFVDQDFTGDEQRTRLDVMHVRCDGEPVPVRSTPPRAAMKAQQA